MERSRRADAVVFGFDFQVNAAIVLFLENVKDIKSLRLEGDYEDIEIELVYGKVLAGYTNVIRITLPLILFRNRHAPDGNCSRFFQNSPVAPVQLKRHLVKTKCLKC